MSNPSSYGSSVPVVLKYEPRPAASTSSGKLLEIQILDLIPLQTHARPTKLETLRVGSAMYVFF